MLLEKCYFMKNRAFDMEIKKQRLGQKQSKYLASLVFGQITF